MTRLAAQLPRACNPGPVLSNCIDVRTLSIIMVVLAACLAQAAERTFTSPDNSFQLSYPENFRLYASEQLDSPDSLACTAPPSLTALACIRPDVSKFKRTTLVDAALRIETVPAANEGACLDYSDWQFEDAVKTTAFTINGIPFHKAVMGAASRGHTTEETLYRGFHDSRCYELDITITYNAEADDERKPFTKTDAAKVARTLQAVVNTFRFTK